MDACACHGLIRLSGLQFLFFFLFSMEYFTQYAALIECGLNYAANGAPLLFFWPFVFNNFLYTQDNVYTSVASFLSRPAVQCIPSTQSHLFSFFSLFTIGSINHDRYTHHRAARRNGSQNVSKNNMYVYEIVGDV